MAGRLNCHALLLSQTASTLQLTARPLQQTARPLQQTFTRHVSCSSTNKAGRLLAATSTYTPASCSGAPLPAEHRRNHVAASSGNRVASGNHVASGNNMAHVVANTRSLCTSANCEQRYQTPRWKHPLKLANRMARNRKNRMSPHEMTIEDYDELYRDMKPRGMPNSVYKAFPKFEVNISGGKMTTDEAELHKLFSEYGEVAQVDIPDQPLQSKEYTWIDRHRHGTVKYKCRSAYERALKAEKVHCKLGYPIDIRAPPPEDWYEREKLRWKALEQGQVQYRGHQAFEPPRASSPQEYKNRQREAKREWRGKWETAE